MRHLSCVSLCIFFTIASTEWAEASERGRLRPDENTNVLAPLEQKPAFFKSNGIARNSGIQALDRLNVLEPDPPELCMGHGELNSISLTEWETGLESWTVDTHDIADSKVFATPDWAVVGSLPDERPGMAAFVANLDIGDCEADDQTGALTLDSPPILIPAGTLVPRISVDHWVATEFQFDGGNIKISVNGGGFTLIPASAIEFSPYNSTLTSAIDGNTNPLAGEDAFTGTDDGGASGSWGQSHIRLFGIAEAEETIQLRFDFGIDGCHGVTGWYVDDVEVYSCSAELLPSDCGNGAIDGDEQCDDGNTFIDDGCSNICEIDEGWQCIGHSRPGVILDPSFEAGTPNPSWDEASTNFNTPICEWGDCPTGGGSSPPDGSFWAWFGGEENDPEEASLSQSVVFPLMATELQFELEVNACDSASDYFEVLIDGNQELSLDGSSPLCWIVGYATQSVDISAYADGGAHDIQFHAETFAANSAVSNFFVDAVSLPGNASICIKKNTNPIIFNDGFESN
jgi:cysteine-rich repeat protein